MFNSITIRIMIQELSEFIRAGIGFHSFHKNLCDIDNMRAAFKKAALKIKLGKT